MSSDSNEQQQQQQAADITNLQESFLQQQEKISALKELVRKSGAAHGSSKSATQEKVKNIAERLMKSKAKSRQGLNVSTYSTEVTSDEASLGYEEKVSVLNISQASPMPGHSSTPNPTPNKQQPSVSTYTTPGSEKIALMRQQLEQNRLRMAQKASSKQHLEQLVTQLKVKFDSTQQCLEDTSELGRSMSDLSNLIYTPVSRERHKSATDLSTQSFSLEKERIKFLENRCRLLEKQLEKEKQNNSRNNLPPSNRDTEIRIQELENALADKEREFEEKEKSLRNDLCNLQSLIDNHSADYENVKLYDSEKERLNERIENLTEENNRLRQEMQIKKTQPSTEEIGHLKNQLEEFASKDCTGSSDLKAENEQLQKDLEAQLKRCHDLNEINDVLETARCDLTSRNTQLEEQLKELQAEMIATKENLRYSEEKYHQLQITAEGNKQPEISDTDSMVKAEMAKQIQELMDEILELRKENSKLQEALNEKEKLEINDSSIAMKIASLEATIESQREELGKFQETLKRNEEELMEKTIELNVLNANFKVVEEKLEAYNKNKPLFSSSLAGNTDSNHAELESENQQLKMKLDESNKAMIKLKLKCKQTEKQVEKLRKGSDLNKEVIKLEKERDELQQKITELEDVKGQWQLVQMESSVPRETTFKEYEEKIESLTNALAESQQQFNTLKLGEQARVKNELNEIQLEESVKELMNEVMSLRNELQNKEKLLQMANERIDAVQQQKDELDKKLEHYLNENIELLDKVEKLSKSSSSAESIEIVERLTQQEKQELEEFNKRLETGEEVPSEMPCQKDSVNELTQTEMNPELTESLNKIREESSELLSKIELFTTERREVLEKMEHLNSENQELLHRIEVLTHERNDIQSKLDLAKQKQDELQIKLESVSKEKDSLTVQMAESRAHKNQLSQELTSLQQSSEVVAALDNGETLFDKCEKSLSKLNCELEAYRKANDKKSKFNVSKKLAKEAENAHSQLSELLQKVKEASSAVETVTVVETVVAVTAPNGKALAEYEQLTAQNRELKATIVELRRLLDEARDNQEDQSDNRSSEERPAIKPDPVNDIDAEAKLKVAIEEKVNYENQLTELQSRVDDLTRELFDARTGDAEKLEEISKLSEEIITLKKISEDFDRIIDDKEMAHEKQIEQLTRLRKELESKCDTYEQEMEILQTLVAEQKQQLIEAFKEHEHEMNVKLLDLQQYEEQIRELKQEIIDLKQSSSLAGSELAKDLQSECDKLKEALKINKHLVQEQLNELSNKQETIDTLNQQIIDLYKTMEENANKIVEKEDDIAYLQELYDSNKLQTQELELKLKELESNNQQLQSSHREQQNRLNELSQIETINNQLKVKHQELEQRNKEQLEKLKKYAANLKKKAHQCLEYENKLKVLEAKSNDINTKDDHELRTVNTNLQQQLDETKNQLSAKTVELQDLINVRNILEQEVKQLQLALDEKQCSVNTLQAELTTTRQQLSDWMAGSVETEHLRQELQLKEKELKIQHQQMEDCKKSLAEAQDCAYRLEKLQVETDNLRMELQSAQNKVIKLEGELAMARQETADSTDSTTDNQQLQEDLICTQENLSLKIREIEELRQTLMASQELQSDWGNESSVKNADFENMSKVLSEKSEKLEKAETIIDELENEIMILRERDRENQQIIQDMSKDSQNINKAEDQHNQDALRADLAAQEQKIKEVSEELKAKSLKFEKSKAVIKERNSQIQRLQAQLKDMQEKLSSLPEEEILSPTSRPKADASFNQSLRSELEAVKDAYNKLNDKYNSEKANFQQTITRLETLHDGIQAKLQEDMSYIETIEQENAKFKDKICRLEECVAGFEERRASMERKVNIMDAQLQSRSEEHAKAEDELIYRLNMLSEHDDVIAQRLIDSQSEKEEIEEKVRKLQSDHNQLQNKYNKLEREYLEYKSESGNKFEQEMSDLKERLSKAELDLERQKAVFDGKLAAKVTELDELECELSDQLEKVNFEKRELSEKLERLSDDNSLLQNDILRLQENVNTLELAKAELERESSWLRMQSENSQQDLYELQELRMQSMQDKTEIDNLRHQIESLSANHENELQALRTQIAELDSLRMQVGQNQTDDQVFIETENKRLTDLLAEKEVVIENYQRQNLQLQMAAAASSTSNTNQSDPFALAFGIPPGSAPNQTHESNEIDRVNQDLLEKNAIVSRLQQDLNNLQAEFDVVVQANQEMQRQIADRQQEVGNVQTLQNVASALNDTHATDVIPAPPMFFTSDPSVRSPFDDIIQHSVGTPPQANADIEQPTIEDLQRNVSDLEKHAQDLEHKLAMRNQRETEYEERFRDLENRLHEKDVMFQQTKAELQKVQEDQLTNQTQSTTLEAELESLRNQTRYLETTLQERNRELESLRSEQRARLEEDHLKKTITSLENQILPDPVVQPTLDMFFGNTPAEEFEPFVIPQVSAEPVVEEIIVPKKTYECHPEEMHTTPIASLDIGDDWGDSWGNSEATAEAEHFAKQIVPVTGGQPSLVPREQLLEINMQELNERLQELQLALERSEDQKKELHVKSGKLMKKLKEYKVKIDELQHMAANSGAFRKSTSTESNSMFSDLDAAIQEEMKNQIKVLEGKLEEQQKQQEQFNMEKEKLLKRIDVLTSGNERMAEMKERQDMEVQMYQARIRELQQKVQTLDDWGNEGNSNESATNTASDTHPKQTSACSEDLQKKVDALTMEIQDLTGDRLELQALLEEEKGNSQRAEQTIETLRQKLKVFEDNKPSQDSTQLNNLKIELQNLRESYNNLLDANKKISSDFKAQADVLSLSQGNEMRLQTELDSLQSEVENLRETLVKTKQSLIDLESELSSLKELKAKQLVAAIHQTPTIPQQDFELLKTEKERLEEEIQKLIKENETLKHEASSDKKVERQALVDQLQSLQAENAILKQSTNEDLSVQLQEKESEILHLKQRINDLMNEDQTEKLVLEILTKNQEIHMLKMQVKHLEDDKHELENNLSLQITKEMQANKEEPPTTIIKTDAPKSHELEIQVKELLAEKRQMEEELQVLNNHVLESLQQEDKLKALTLELDTKNIEIAELRKTVNAVQKGVRGETTRTDESVDFDALNAQWESIVEQRCSEIAKMWQDHLAQREKDFQRQEERLREEIASLKEKQSINVTGNESVQQIMSVETMSSSTPASESTTASDSTSAEASQDGTPLHIIARDNVANADAIIEQMQSALESQEMEIVTLKEQLAIRSAEYARLAAQYDPFKLQNTSSHIGIMESRKSASSSDVPTVSKSELDLALYMLHQRDMRCEEMTLELVSLLEERDTLQLKLSNTLRQMEAIKAQIGGLPDGTAIAVPSIAQPENDSITSTSVAGSTVGTADDELNLKLSQLQTVSHTKDKVIKEEREQRIRQMEKLHQDVAKMPPAAVSELTGTNMSQTNQSPSTALLNWLWGNKSGNPGSAKPPDF